MVSNTAQEDHSITVLLKRINLMNADINRMNQERRFAPILLTLTAMGSCAALFASALAFFMLVGI